MKAGHLRVQTPDDAEKHRSHVRVPWQLFFTSRSAGWGVATTAAGVGLILHNAITARAVLLIAGVALMYWIGFAINDYFDARSDAPDEYKARHNPFVRNHFDRRTLVAAVIVLLASVLALFASFGVLGIVMYALASAAMWGYSAPPLRIKNRPGSDLLFCGMFGLVFPYVLPLVLMRAPLSVVDGYVLPIGFLAGIAGQLRQQIRDFEIDSPSEVTFTTTFGVHTASRLLGAIVVAILLLLLSALLTRTIPLVFAPVAALSVPVLLECFFAPARRNMPMDLYRVSSMVALFYLLILIGVSLHR